MNGYFSYFKNCLQIRMTEQEQWDNLKHFQNLPLIMIEHFIVLLKYMKLNGLTMRLSTPFQMRE